MQDDDYFATMQDIYTEAGATQSGGGTPPSHFTSSSSDKKGFLKSYKSEVSI